jgi:hypothetical protein
VQALRLLAVTVLLFAAHLCILPGKSDEASQKKLLALEGARPDENEEGIEGFIKDLTGPLRIGQSRPVNVKDARFVLVAQTNWRPGRPDPSFPLAAPIEIQLQITNLKKSDLLFPTYSTFGVRIFKADGKEVKPRTAGKASTVTRPLVLAGGASYALRRRAELRWDEKSRASELLYSDGTGAERRFGPLPPGQYKLVWWYSVAPDKQAKPKPGDAATWVGEAITEEVPFQVLKGMARGYLQATERPLKLVPEPIHIRESKPVTVKEAQFAVAAQTNWKPGKPGQLVPIEIQLRITNLGKGDVLFHTFDTFGMGLIDSAGERVTEHGGRDLTILTRPVVLPSGASYSLCTEGAAPLFRRLAELRWDVKTRVAELFYHDGTGSEFWYGPLKPGRYQLGFSYSASARAPLKELLRPERKKGDPPTWFGRAVTDKVLIGVLDR